MTVFSREVLTNWAATRGINTALFDSEAEWELLDELAALHCANMQIPTDQLTAVQNLKGKRSHMPRAIEHALLILQRLNESTTNRTVQWILQNAAAHLNRIAPTLPNSVEAWNGMMDGIESGEWHRSFEIWYQNLLNSEKDTNATSD